MEFINVFMEFHTFYIFCIVFVIFNIYKNFYELVFYIELSFLAFIILGVKYIVVYQIYIDTGLPKGDVGRLTTINKTAK